MTTEQNDKYNRFHSNHEKVLNEYVRAIRALTFGCDFREECVQSYLLYVLRFGTWIDSDDFLRTQAGVQNAYRQALAGTETLQKQLENLKEC